ncbi:MAG: EAL domain-containing protein [Sulfuricurvum sp.]|nr:EAL domain-containing protein [Sulfuricurvum sp.]
MDSIHSILETKRLAIHFQPILSVRGRTFFGVEALVRGIASDGSLLSPAWLFEQASLYGLSSELDRLARLLAIESFLPLWQANKRLILFVNFESKLIDAFESGRYLFDGLLSRYQIPFSNIVLEIKEDEVNDTLKLQDFCTHYRNLGFNIALDDFGIGRSSFDRLGIVRPDIIKIDRSLVADIDTNYIHQEIVRAICRMSTNIGAIALAEGIERLEEAGYSQHLGITLIQGFWIAKPSLNPVCENFREKVDQLKSNADALASERHTNDQDLRNQAELLFSQVIQTITATEDLVTWSEKVRPIAAVEPNIEALYLIDSSAAQVGPTLLLRATRSFFEPMREGCDHSRKEYYARTIESMNNFYLTGNYVSLATGNLCCTYARKITIEGKTYVFCIDFIR